MPIDRKARILDVASWGDYRLLTIESAEVGREARPGQFVMVKVAEGTLPLLRRPLSIHDARPNGIDLFFQVAGAGTGILSRKEPGETVDLLGPLGKGFGVSGWLGGKRVACVGGGRGIAPLYFLGRELLAAGAEPTIFYGGRTGRDIPLKSRLEDAGFRVLCSTDDGSAGFKGFVTELFEAEAGKGSFDALFACGPDPMMKSLSKTASALGIPAEFSLESVMGCGIGACWGCVHRIRTEGGKADWTKICEDGPVFSGDEVVWED
jgi:dihydroorotate dehydrogenase electron transfer subunit